MQVLFALEDVQKHHACVGSQPALTGVCAHKVDAAALACVQQDQVCIVVSVPKAIVQLTEDQTVV